MSHFATLAQLPAGSVAQYPLNNSATDISGNGYNGTLTSTSYDINRFGTANSATAFVAGTSTGSLPSGLVTALANDFTIAYWFKTSMSAPSSTQWYGGAAMVDAEVCGATSDWGTALINGGQVAMGLGNPDITIISPLSYNDGAWHFFTATRAEAAGVITLYIDGSQVATTSGASTAPRTAPPQIGLGDNNCVAAGVYTGSLDDIIAYNSVLTSTQVSDLYNYFSSIPLPIHWESFTGQVKTGQVWLTWTTEDSGGNAGFTIERSTNGVDFSGIGDVAASDGIPAAAGSFTYRFTDISPAAGNDYYRIRETDENGSSSWTSILEFSLVGNAAALHILTDPVGDGLTLVNDNGVLIQRLQVLDVNGRVLVDQAPYSTNTQIPVPVANLKSGYYFLRIGESDATITLKFVKL